MGGLLAAEAATDPSNAPGAYPATKPSRIVGIIAFDCPYLGMHPHVVISGIASLFPKCDGRSESDLNHHPQVSIVDGDVTDNWETFKKKDNGNIGIVLVSYLHHALIARSVYANPAFRDCNPVLQSRSSASSTSIHSPSSSSFSDDWEAFSRRPNGTNNIHCRPTLLGLLIPCSRSALRSFEPRVSLVRLLFLAFCILCLKPIAFILC